MERDGVHVRPVAREDEFGGRRRREPVRVAALVLICRTEDHVCVLLQCLGQPRLQIDDLVYRNYVSLCNMTWGLPGG